MKHSKQSFIWNTNLMRIININIASHVAIPKFVMAIISIIFIMVIYTMSIKAIGMNVKSKLVKPILIFANQLIAAVTMMKTVAMKWYPMVTIMTIL
ncbi:hypothetical protein H839_08948 [Parageobacillus genomosp. 1]|uniref:Uncharacterized protein n=1 Tax=Parageobacillus genomosp. 1 TaxID=1295642 RepID=A0ABC9VDY9_9BACL|nr:hypothetical protein H839_08948 [Parageobacillus genomosp. 1]